MSSLPETIGRRALVASVQIRLEKKLTQLSRGPRADEEQDGGTEESRLLLARNAVKPFVGSTSN